MRRAAIPKPVDPTPAAIPETELWADGALKHQDAARFLGVSREQLYRLNLPWAQDGRFRKYPRRALVAYLAGLPKGV